MINIHLGDTIPSLTDWIQAICAISMLIIAIFAYNQWKDKEYFSLRKEGVRMKEQAFKLILDILSYDDSPYCSKEDDQKKIEYYNSIEKGFGDCLNLLLHFNHFMDLQEERRDSLITLANQTQLLPKGDPIKEYYKQFLILSNDIPNTITRYLNDKYVNYHMKFGNKADFPLINSPEGHLDDEDFYNSIFKNPYFGKLSIMDDLLHTKEKIINLKK